MTTVFITAADIRHIKNKHGEGEDRRGQIDIKPENISEIYDAVNDFDSATKERDDNQRYQNIMVIKAGNGTSYILLVERGKSKAQVKTFYKIKEASQMSDAKSPNFNARNDSAKTSAENIAQAKSSDKAETSEEESAAPAKNTELSDSIFETGEFVNPETGKKQAGIKFTRELPRQEYLRIEEIADEYGGYYYDDGNTILFGSAADRDAFVDDVKGNYHGSPVTQPLSQARDITGLKKILRMVYRIEIPHIESLNMGIRRLKQAIGNFINTFAKADMIKYVNGEIEYSSEADYQTVKDFFGNMLRKGESADLNLTSKFEAAPQRDSSESIEQRAQALLEAEYLENRRPKKEESLGKIYGQRESDGTFSAYFSKDIDADKLESLQKMADALGGTFDGKTFKFNDIESLAVFCKAVRTAFYGKRDKPNQENKKADNTAGVELPEGYRTETGKPLQDSNIYDFIVDADGKRDFGAITAEIERETDGIVKAAPVRLQVGNGEFGYIHLTVKHLAEMKRKGFADSISYVENILQNINKIYSRADTGNLNRFLLCSNGEAGHSDNFMPVDLELEKGADGYYRIITAYSKSSKNVEGILIFDDSTHSSPDTATGSLMRLTDDKSGVGYQGANAKTNIPSKENITQTAPSDKTEIIYPDGALVYGNQSALERFKGDYKDKKFDEQLNRKVKIDGRELTRLEVVEGMAKGELDESAMKLNKRESEYLDYLKRYIIAPLKAIQQAGIQTEQSTAQSHPIIKDKTVYFEGMKNDSATLTQLTKLAEALGGKAEKNSAGNTLFKFEAPNAPWEFRRAAKFFMDNGHLPYFGRKSVAAAEKNPLAELKNIKLPDGVKVSKVDMAQNKQGVWRVKPVGTFPNKNSLWDTQKLFIAVAQYFGGNYYHSDGTFHFKDKDSAQNFKRTLDDYFGRKVTAQTFTDNPLAIFNRDAISTKLPAWFREAVKTLGDKVTAKLKDGSLTQAQAEEIAGELMDKFDTIAAQFDDGTLTKAEAQNQAYAAVTELERRFESKAEDKTPVEVEETETLTANFNPFRNLNLPQNLSEKFKRAYEAIKAAWSAYEAGELDIRETAHKVREIVQGALLKADEFGNADREREADILLAIQNRIQNVEVTPEDQKANDDAWYSFFVMKRAFDVMHNAGKISDDEYKARRKKINDLESKANHAYGAQYEEITKVKAFAKLRELLPEVKEAEIKAYLTAAEENPHKEKILWQLMNHEIDGASVIYSDDSYNMKAIDADIESGKVDVWLSRAQFDRQGDFIGFKTEETAPTKAADKDKQAPSKAEQRDAERAASEIDGLIEEWNKESHGYQAAINPPTHMARKLSEMVTAGVIAPDEAIETANKLLNGTDEEKDSARELYYDTLRKFKEKRAKEFNPAEGIARLKKIAEKFPVLKADVEREIKAINDGRGARLVNNESSLLGRSAGRLEQWATFKLLQEWARPYKAQLNQSVFKSANPTVAEKIHSEVYALINKVDYGEISGEGIYKQAEAILNAPHEGLMTDDEWRQKTALNDRVEYLFFKNHGKASLEKIQSDVEKTFGKEFADSIASQIEAAYDELVNDSQNVSRAQNKDSRAKVLTKTRGEETERAIVNAFEVDSKNFKTIGTIRRELYDKVKADAHPNLKAYVDQLLETVASPQTSKADMRKATDEIFGIYRWEDDRLDELEKAAVKYNPGAETRQEAEAVTEDETKAQTLETTANEKNPFDVEILDNAVTQSAEFKQTLRDMQDVWKAYQRGELDIRETAKKIDAAIEYYREKHDEYNVHVGSAVGSLWAIKRNVEDIMHSPEEKAKHDAGWEKFVALVDKITPLNRAGKLSNEEHAKLNKEIRRLVKQVQGNNITGQTAYERLKEKLPASITEEALADVEESGTGARFDDGHRDVEPAIRTGADEETRTQGRDKISDEDTGQQRPTGESVGARNSAANAENDRPVQTNDAGGASSRTGDGTGLRGDTGSVQSADGTERGRSRIPADVEIATELNGKPLRAEIPKSDKKLIYLVSEGIKNAYDLGKDTIEAINRMAESSHCETHQFYDNPPGGEFALYRFSKVNDAEEFKEALEKFINNKARQETEQRAREALKAAGLEESGAFESRGISIKVDSTQDGTKRVSIDLGKHGGLTNVDKAAYEKIAAALGAKQDEIHYRIFTCGEKIAPVLKRAFEIFLEQGVDGRITAAFEKLKSENNFTSEQLKWLDRIERYMHAGKAYGRLTPEGFQGGVGTPFEEIGGFERIDKILDNKLAEMLSKINEHVYDKKQAAKEYETAGHNFHITAESGIGEGGLKAKFKQNVDAIKLLKQLEAEGRKATPSEQAILAKFNGWGTLASAFSNDPKWAKENQQLRELLTPEEYAAAHGAITNAFYTSPEIASAMWRGLERMGFKGGRILDPSTGSGIFFGTMPTEFAAQSELVGVELDSLTGRIAQQLYQKADIEITGFQNRALPDNYFDLAISNVPFGSEVYRHDGKDYKLHDYFFAKATDKVRPGGLVAFITSTGSMLGKLRFGVQDKADLIAAFKLPSNAFDKNAATQVTSDILIFQKRADPSKPSEHAQEWREPDDIIADGKELYANEYFVKHPDHMIGKPIEDTLYSGRGRLALDGTGHDVAKELGDLMSKLPENIYTPIQHATTSTLDNTLLKLAATAQEGAFTAKDGKLYQKQGDNLVELTGKEAQTVKDYQSLRKALDALMAAQLDSSTAEEKLSTLRQKLNDNYDAFVANNGYVNAAKNVRLLGADPAFGHVAAIEDYSVDKKTKQVSASKADIFFKRVAGKEKEPASAGTAVDGLNISLNLRGRVDMNYISDLTGKSESELERDLGDLIYRNPLTNLHELAEEYLSGNVREKLAQAQKAARHNPAFKRNIEALEKVQPLDLTEHDIYPHLGATWIDSEYYEDFARHLLGNDLSAVRIHYSAAGVWAVEGFAIPGTNFYKWHVSRPRAPLNFFDLLEAAMNNKSVRVNDPKGNVDPVKTAEANQKLEDLRDAFEEWIWKDAARKKDLLAKYNVMFNSEVLRNYDGSHLTFPKTEGFPELSSDVKDKLYKHQKDAIWRIMQGKNTLLAHCVGAGKTWTMQIAAMEMKRMGLIRKPLFAVPNNITEQFALDFKKAYPKAKLLVLTSNELKDVNFDFTYDEKLNLSGRMQAPKSAIEVKTDETAAQKRERLATRRRTLSKIATGDWDGIIISHNLFQRLPVSPEAEKAFIQEQLDLLEREKRELTGGKEGTKGFEKQLQSAINHLKAKLQADVEAMRREIIMPFEELGIDQIFVDEADMFKNLGFVTNFTNRTKGQPKTVGISTSNATRSRDMYLKTKLLTKMRNGGGVVFATGTPISNTLNEIFTMQRYLDFQTLEEKGIYYFDGWAGNFARGVPGVELSTKGTGYDQVIRLKLTNLQALIKLYRKFADIKMPEDLPHLKRPKLKGDARTVVQIKPSKALKDFLEDVDKRAEAIQAGGVDPSEDNYLKINSELRKASLDMRLIDPSIPESEAGAKLAALCDTVTAKYKETAHVKGAQLIFLDMGIPKDEDLSQEAKTSEESALEAETSAEDVAMYKRIKDGLIKRGMPANQIAFVHEAKDAKQRQTLFKHVNDGEIRVIIGSTGKMGAGTNFQKHLVALHHLDCPWRPRDIEQREGRILRAGNQNAEVEIFTYVTKGSYDANMWEKVMQKKMMMDALLRGDPSIKEMPDFSKEALGYGDIKTRGLDNPLLQEQSRLFVELHRLKYFKKAYAQLQREKTAERKKISMQVQQTEQQIKNLKADIASKVDTRGDAFKMTIGDSEYTERAEAGKAFDKLIQTFNKTTSTKVGSIGGFDINMRVEFTQALRGGVLETVSKQVIVTLSNRGTYNVEPSLRSIEYFISQGIEKLQASAEKTLTRDKARIAALDSELAKPFDKQAELTATEKRLEAINAQLNIKGTPKAEASAMQIESPEADESWQKSWDAYERYEESLSDTEKTITDRGAFNLDGFNVDAAIYINWNADDSGHVLKADGNKTNFVVSYYVGESLGDLKDTFDDKLVLLAEAAGGQVQKSRGGSGKYQFEFDAYQDATNFATTIRAELEHFATEHANDRLQAEPTPAQFKVESLAEPELKDNTARITTKKAANGVTLYYDPQGKKISANKAWSLEDPTFSSAAGLSTQYESKDERVRELLLRYKAVDGASDLNSMHEWQNKRPAFHTDVFFRIGDQTRNATRYFETMEDALACAKFVYQNKGNVRISDIFVTPNGSYSNAENSVAHIDADGNGTIKSEASKTAEQINEAAQDPDTANALEQLGAKVENGKVTIPDAETRDAVVNHLETMEAWHGSPYSFNEFSTDSIGNGEGAQAHGWGLYFAAGRDTAEKYRQSLTPQSVKIKGKTARIGHKNGRVAWLYDNGQEVSRAEEIACFALFENHSDSQTAIKAIREFTLKKEPQDAQDAINLLQDGEIKTGSLFKVEIPDSALMLDEEKILSKQPPKVKAAVEEIATQRGITIKDDAKGREIYQAIAKTFEAGWGKFDADVIKMNPSNMAASQLLNERGVKGITYNGGKDKRCYVVFDDKAIKILEKLSLRGAGNTDIKNFVKPQDLTPQQKLLQRFGKRLGVRVEFFRNKNGNFHGAHARGITFLNVNSKMPLGKVFWHESMHWLKSNNPVLYRQLAKAAGITDAQRRAYLKETGRKDLKTRAEIDEEFLSDQMFDAAKRTGLLQSIAGKNRGLIERVVQWLKDTMNEFIDYFRNPQGKLTTAQAQAFAAEFGKIADKLVDANGKKIFRYNRRTGDIEIIGRRNVETRTNFVDKQAAFADNAPDLSQKVFDKYLTDGIMAMVRETVGKEISEHIDLSKMSDPVAREDARDRLPYIRQLLTYYNLREVQDNEAYKNRLATKIEYARRCFDNDERIRTESVRQMDGDKRQGGIREARSATVSKSNAQGIGSHVRGSDVGVSRSVSGGKSGARNHFLKLYNEIAMSERSNRRGVFSSARPSRYGRRVDDNQTDIPFDEKALAAEVEKAKREGTLKLSFAGERAQTANHEKLAEAQRMEADGKTRDDIFKKTGWIKGKDDKWRFEIPDSLDKINFDKLKRNGQATLGEVYDNPKLYEAYPALQNLQIFATDSVAALGAYSPLDDTIKISFHQNGDGRREQALIHELQHAIQQIEGFAVGASMYDEFYELSGGEMEADEAAQRAQALHDVKTKHNPAKDLPSRKKFLQLYNSATKEQRHALEKFIATENDYQSNDATIRKQARQRRRDIKKDLRESLGLDFFDFVKINQMLMALFQYHADLMESNAKQKAALGTPIIHTDSAIIKFGGKEYAMASMTEPDMKKAAVTVTGDEFGEYSDIKELRQKAIQYYKEHLQGTSVFNEKLGKIDIDENGLVEFTASGRKKVASTSAQEQKLLLVKYLPQLITNANEIQKADSIKERHKDDIFYYMKGSANINGATMPVHITLIKHNAGRIQFYNHSVEQMENAPVNSAEPVSSNEALGLPPVGASSDRNIAQTKFAGNGDLERMFAAAKVLTTSELTSQERKWVELGKSLGVQVKWIEAHTDLKGALQDGVIYLNRRANNSVAQTFWHEQFHLTAALKPKLYQDLLEYFTGNDAFTKEQLDAYREENNRPDLSDAAVIEEILSDNFGQVQKRVKLMQEMSASNPSLAGRFVAWLKYLADKIAATFRNPAGGMTTAQRDAFIKGISELADRVSSVDSAEHTGTKFASSISNSTAKLRDKIQNILTATKNERPRNHMRKLLERLSGYQIKTGHIAEGIDILVKDISKVIRTRRAYDWELILPAVGEQVAQRLNLNPTPELKNYIAGWLMDGEPNNTSQAAKDFQQAMRNADDMYRDQLLEVQSIFHEWNNRPSEQVVRDAQAFGKEGKPLSETAKGYFYDGYKQFVEELYPVQQLVEQIEADRGKKLAADENPFTILRNYRGIAGRAKIMIEEAGAVVINALKAAFPNVDFDKFKTVRMILESVDALDNIENRKQFSDYLLACSVKDLHRRNDANLRRQYEVRETIETLEDELDTLTDKGKIKATEKRIAKLQDELDGLKKKFYATPFDEKTCDGTIAKYKDKYGQAQKDIIAYQRTLLDIMVDSGVLSEDQKLGYIKNFPNHVPMFRKFDENEDKSFGDSLKAMTGSSRDVIAPLESIIKNTYDFIRRAEKNKAKCLLANLAREGGAGNIIEEVDNKKPNVGTVITFFENGEKKYLETDPAVVKAVNNLSVAQMSWFMKFLRVGTMILRNFATVFNPAFAFRNLIMDNQNAFLYCKYGWFSPADFVRGFLSVWNRDADYQEWMAMGGAQASFWSVDRDYTQASLDTLRKGRWGKYKSKPWQLLSALGEWSELGTRVGYFKKAKKALAEKNGGTIDRNILVEAALESRDLTDFARGGKGSRDWNSAVAFANAQIQGWDKFIRTFDPRNGKWKTADRQRAMFRLALGSILPTVLLFMLNHDEDWYEKDLPDWERQTHWCLGEHLRIPKGQDVGLRFFSNLTESILRSTASNDPKAFENWFKPVKDSFPDWCPTALQPIIECATNYDMFRKMPIVPQRQQRLSEHMQYDSHTSALAKALGDSSLAKWLAGETGISPAKIDRFLYGYTGKLGQDFLRFAENVTGARDFDYKGFTDLPIISGVKSGFLRVPYRNPRILTEYYETLDEQTKLHNEFKLTKKRPDGYDHNLYTRLEKAQKEMREFTKKERKLLDDPRLDADERDNRQLAIQKKRVALAEKVLR